MQSPGRSRGASSLSRPIPWPVGCGNESPSPASTIGWRQARSTSPAGTPVTVEPGVYLPGFGGIRIEDLVIARPGGHELLTPFPKELLEL